MNARWQLRLRAPAFWQQPPGLVARLLAPVATRYGDHVISRMDQTGARAGVPVLCIGNFTLGGAGKTPAVIMLAKMLAERGGRPFCLSRGYGGTEAGPKLVDSRADSHCARSCGRRRTCASARRKRCHSR